MKKILFCAALAMAMGAAIAVPISAEVTTTGPEGEDSGYIKSYAAYLCTVEAAKNYFDGNYAYDTVADWLEKNYETGIGNLKGAGKEVAMDPYGFDDGEYSFTKYFQSELEGDYLAVMTYAADDGTSWFRVFGNTADVDGTVTMDAVDHVGQAGAWTAAAVPEPTSGMLFLLGLASLALRRKRGEG